MKETVRWKKVLRNGLSRYQVSDNAQIRIKLTRKVLPFSAERNGEKMVSLTFFGKPKTFSINELMFQTFKKTTEKMYDDVPDIEFLAKTERFSENEEDYGGRGGGEWEEIRVLAKKATYNKESKY